MNIPEFPSRTRLVLDHMDELRPFFDELDSGISELTFSNVYLFRDTYGYEVSSLADGYALFGSKEGKRFALVPGLTDPGFLSELFEEVDYLKCLSEEQAEALRIVASNQGYCVGEDRDNFDYLYDRVDLADLKGKKFHKKRNLVKQFLHSYEHGQCRLSVETVPDALAVLEAWREGRPDDGDYKAAREGIERMGELGLQGCTYYVDNRPAGYVLGEPLGDGTSFAVHFEKALGHRFKGVYQYINQAFAQLLPERFEKINREQDLGDEGMRQAKLSYRPSGFVKKYRVYPVETCPCDDHNPTKMSANHPVPTFS